MPDILRLEYKLEVDHADGGTEHVCDPDNPKRAPGAFGEKSVLELPGYEPPAWLDAEGVEGEYASSGSAAAGSARTCRSGSGARRAPPPASRCGCCSPTTGRSTTSSRS